MIPTQYKAKLPKHLSYPLGAEAISKALAGVPQFDELRLWFTDRAVNSAIEFQDILRSGTPYRLLEVSFEKFIPDLSASHSMLDAGYYDRKWKVTIYPVSRTLRHTAHSALLQHALPAAKQWLSHPSAAAWTSGYKRLTFTFHPADGSVTSETAGDALS